MEPTSKERRGKISVLRHRIHTLFTFLFIISAIRPYTTLILYLLNCLIRLLQQIVSKPLASAGLAAPAIHSDGRHQTCTPACTSISLDSTSESHFPRRIQGPPPSSNSTLSLRQVQSSCCTAVWLRTNNYNFRIYSQQLIYPRNGNLPLKQRLVTILLLRQPKAVFYLI